MTAITYPAVYRLSMTGETIKAILEDVADNLFNPDPYYQQGGDMVRVGGMAYTINVDAPIGGAHRQFAPCCGRRRRSSRRASTSWRAGGRSTKTCRARRSGTSWPATCRPNGQVTPRPRHAVKIVRAGG